MQPHLNASKYLMFNFFHPRPVVDGRAVAVKIVQQQASAQQDTLTLIVSDQETSAPEAPAAAKLPINSVHLLRVGPGQR